MAVVANWYDMRMKVTLKGGIFDGEPCELDPEARGHYIRIPVMCKTPVGRLPNGRYKFEWVQWGTAVYRHVDGETEAQYDYIM